MVTESLTTLSAIIPLSATPELTHPASEPRDNVQKSVQLAKMFINYLQLLACVWCAVMPSAVQASWACTPSRVNTALTQKAQDGRASCATSPPNETVTADFAIECVAACQVRESCRDGVNYRSDDELCELYHDPPTSYQVQPNCRYIRV